MFKKEIEKIDKVSLMKKNPGFKIEETTNQYRVRILNPQLFQKTSFRTKKLSYGISFLIGHLIGKTTTSIQSVHFDKSSWNRESVKKWVTEYYIEYLKGFKNNPVLSKSTLQLYKEFNINKKDILNDIGQVLLKLNSGKWKGTDSDAKRILNNSTNSFISNIFYNSYKSYIKKIYDNLVKKGTWKYNPSLTKIYDRAIELRGYKANGEHAGKYKHPFETSASIYGAQDGSVIIKSNTGERLWGANPHYSKEYISKAVSGILYKYARYSLNWNSPVKVHYNPDTHNGYVGYEVSNISGHKTGRMPFKIVKDTLYLKMGKFVHEAKIME
jgi:hypothetical protein